MLPAFAYGLMALCGPGAVPQAIVLETPPGGGSAVREISGHISDRVSAVWGLTPLTRAPPRGRVGVFSIQVRGAGVDEVEIAIGDVRSVFAVRTIGVGDLEAAKVSAWLAVKSAIRRAMLRAPGVASAALPPPPPSPVLVAVAAPVVPAVAAPVAAPVARVAPVAPVAVAEHTPEIPAPRAAAPVVALAPDEARIARGQDGQDGEAALSPVPPVLSRSDPAMLETPFAPAIEGWSFSLAASSALSNAGEVQLGVAVGASTVLRDFVLVGAGVDYQHTELTGVSVDRIPLRAWIALRTPIAPISLSFGLYGAVDLKLVSRRALIGVDLGPMVRLRLPMVAIGSGDLALIVDGGIGVRLRRQEYLLDSGTGREGAWAAALRTGVDWRWR